MRGRLGDDGLEVELIARAHVAVPCERQLGGRTDSCEHELIEGLTLWCRASGGLKVEMIPTHIAVPDSFCAVSV